MVFHALGNALIGVAIGLLAYHAITAAFTGAEQTALRRELGAAGRIEVGATEATTSPGGPRLDFDGWADEEGAYWGSLGAGGVFGRIVAPAIDLDAVVVKGVERQDLKAGPGWAPYTDLPGPQGNVGISGHRTTYGAPFRRIDRLAPGDVIDLYSPVRRYRYVVERQLVVTPDKVEVFNTTEEPMLTLTACHPPYSARYRIVVQASLLDVRRIDDIPKE